MVRPRTLAELTRDGNTYQFVSSVPYTRWIFVAKRILHEADVYNLEKRFDEAYLLYARFLDLMLYSMPKHPESSAPRSKELKKQLKGKIEYAVICMEKLKPIIEQQVAAYDFEQKEKALQIKQKEEQRQRYQQPAQFNSSQNQFAISDQDHNNNLHSIRFLQDNPSAQSPSGVPQISTLNSSFSYPSQSYTSAYSSDVIHPANISPPALPNKTIISDVLTPYNVPYSQQPIPPPLPPQSESSSASKVPEFKSKNTTEGGAPLRTVFLPENLRSKFLQIALPNTRQNLETCGMLCGKLQHNAFFITHLAIPHQESTSDTCTTTHEELLFNYLDENDLFILGWIHTHPTQSCFLSSVDLHTQNSYQIMLPESIAIVCAPQHEPAWGVFRLTDPRGINLIKSCNKTGFHPHPESNLYLSAHNPGHIMIRRDIPFVVEDLRTRKPDDS